MTQLNQIEANWELIKNQIHNRWSNLSLEEIEHTGMDSNKLLNLIKKKNKNQSAAENELNHILETGKNKTLRRNPNFYDSEYDERDDEGMTSIDTHTADYSGFGLPLPESNEIETSPQREIELPIRPHTIETGNEQNNEPTKPDEAINNLSPQENIFFEEITQGRSNSSANTTSPSALISSEVTKGL